MNQNPHQDDALTWAALLGTWTDFAKAAVALPNDAHGTSWKHSVPAIIDLQATIHALAELDRLPPDHRAAAIDTAEAIITSRTAQLQDVWANEPPEGIVEVILDAHSAAKAATASLASSPHTPHHDTPALPEDPAAKIG